MSITILLKSLSERISSWTTMKDMLRVCNLPIGHGWDKTIKNLEDKNKIGDNFADAFYKLKGLYSNHILIGQKAVKFFQIEKQDIEKLIILLQQHQIESTIFQEYYPCLLPEEKLKEVDLSPKLVEIKDTKETLSLVFCTRRSFTERIEIDINDFSTEVQSKLIYYDKLFGTKKNIYQFFDVIVLWKEKGIIEVRVDILNISTSQERNQSFFRIVEQFNRLVQEKLGIEIILKDCINLFPIIDKLYKSDNEGKVTELSFITDEGSIKSEKMKKDKVDLRYETYHKAGRKAVHHITPYYLTVLWDFEISEKINTQIELILPGKSYHLSSLNPSLEEVIIRKCGFLEEYNFIFNKINEYLE